MLIPGQNKLAKPEVVKVESFEVMLAGFKATVLAHIAKSDPAMAAQVAEALANEAELATKLIEASVVALQTHTRKYNERIEQMLAWWAEGSNLDAKVADLGIERQVLVSGDPSAFPPVPAQLEEDDRLRLRYYLAPHAPAAGSRMHYRHEVLTLGDRARVDVQAPEAGKVVVTYTLRPDGFAAQVKDGNGLQVAPGTGEVRVTVLARAGDGSASPELLQAVRAHFARPDVAPATDLVTVQGAEILPYQIKAKAWVNSGPDSTLTIAEAERQLQVYASETHQLGGRVDRSWIDYALHSAGAVRLEVIEPLVSVVGGAHQAPYCTGIELEVLTL